MNNKSFLPSPAEKEFSLKSYVWARGIAQQEAKDGFPILKEIKSFHVDDYLNYYANLSSSESILYVSAMVKRYSKQGLVLSGDSMSVQEQKLVDDYLNQPRMLLSKREKRIKVDRSRIKNKLLIKLPAVVGQLKHHLDDHSWSHSIHCGKWIVETRIRTGHKFHPIEYG